MDPIQPIKPINSNKPMLKKSLPMLAVLVLLVGVFFSVKYSQQSQENRSRASGYDYYSYSGGYNNYDSNNSYGTHLTYCNKTMTIYGHNYTYSVPCTATPTPKPYYAPTATPTPKPSQCWSVYYRNQSYGTYYGSYSTYSSRYSTSNGYQVVACTTPTPTPIPYYAPTATPVPYYAPTATPIPYYAPTATPVPYYAPTATPAPASYGNTQAKLFVFLHGLGLAGDNVNPSAQGNMSPLHPQRTVDVQIFNSSNALVSDTQTTLSFNSSDGNFTGQANLGTLASGLYNIKIKTDQYLRGLVPGIQTLSVGQTNSIAPIKLVVGDVNGDNQINILDYNILIGCYSDLEPAQSCTNSNKLLTDLNDDGNVNQYDYNLFIRELTNLNGQ
ncbi:MAG: dockerin type I domain-containing protein [Candidatus Levyibacteriota bacterium]